MGVRGVLPHSTLTRSYISYLASLSTFPIGKAGTTLSPELSEGLRAAVSRVGAGQSIPLVPSDGTGGEGSSQAGDKGSGTGPWDWPWLLQVRRTWHVTCCLLSSGLWL